MKINFMAAITGILCLGLSACQSSETFVQPADEAESLSFASFKNKVKIMDHDSKSITYEYSDVRVDQVSVLAFQYCQEMSGSKAFLDKVILYKNNARRAKFNCYK